MTTVNQVSAKKVLGSPEYSRNRYLLQVVRELIKSDYTHLYHNGAEGMELAIINNNVELSYSEAVEELASRENVTEDAITNDYDNWYYIIPLTEVVESLESTIAYYSPLKES